MIACNNRHNEARFSTVNDQPKRKRWVHPGARSASTANAVWYPHSGATDHVTINVENIQVQDQNKIDGSVCIANSKFISVTHTGESSALYGKNCKLKNILFVSNIMKILLFVRKFCFDNNVAVEFNKNFVSIKDQITDEKLLSGGIKNVLYQLGLKEEDESPQINSVAKASLMDWHVCLGHTHMNRVKKLLDCMIYPYQIKE